MEKENNYINLIIKPTNACNLRCRHCYAADIGYNAQKMQISTVNFIINFFAQFYKNVRIIWHGGEPLLMGIDFYKEVIEIEKQFPNTMFSNGIQTNATLINDEWIDFLKTNKINVGISYDGQYNDVLRDKTKQVQDSIKLMQDRNFRFGAICVISGKTQDKLIEIYKHFKKLQISFKFNPLFISGEAKKHSELFLSTDDYLESITKFFDLWLYDKDCNINVDNFIEAIAKSVGVNKSQCSNSSCLTKWFGITYDGNIFPCGRSFSWDYCMGNIKDFNSPKEIFLSNKYQNLLSGAIKRREWCKANCDFYNYCRGGCNNSAIINGNLERPNISECTITKGLIKKVESEIRNLYLKNYDINLLNPTIRNLIKRGEQKWI